MTKNKTLLMEQVKDQMMEMIDAADAPKKGRYEKMKTKKIDKPEARASPVSGAFGSGEMRYCSCGSTAEPIPGESGMFRCIGCEATLSLTRTLSDEQVRQRRADGLIGGGSDGGSNIRDISWDEVDKLQSGKFKNFPEGDTVIHITAPPKLIDFVRDGETRTRVIITTSEGQYAVSTQLAKEIGKYSHAGECPVKVCRRGKGKEDTKYMVFQAT